MKPLQACLLIPPVICATAGQNGPPQSFMSHGTVERQGGFAKVLVNDPRPLLPAADALQDEYGWRGWLLDYEDPPYPGRIDLVDATAAEWRASHPNHKGVTVPSGGNSKRLTQNLMMEHGTQWKSKERCTK